jgi:hypothetical protein
VAYKKAAVVELKTALTTIAAKKPAPSDPKPDAPPTSLLKVSIFISIYPCILFWTTTMTRVVILHSKRSNVWDILAFQILARDLTGICKDYGE